jgi:hypothetical protein
MPIVRWKPGYGSDGRAGAVRSASPRPTVPPVRRPADGPPGRSPRRAGHGDRTAPQERDAMALLAVSAAALVAVASPTLRERE